MIIDEPGYRPTPTKPRPAAPKPKPVYRPPARPASRPPARPASRPPGVASPYRPKPKTTTPLRPANFSTITASARSRVGNIYAPGGLSFPTPQFTADPASRGAYGVQVPGTTGRRYTATGGYDPAMFKPAPFGPWDKVTTEALVRAGVYGAMPGDQPIPTAQRPDKGKAGTGGGRSGYVPRAYYGGGGGYSGGGGGGGGGSQFERYGISKDWMQAYKAFWGHALPSEAWGMFSPVQELFSRYQSRLPQLDDWQRIWQAAKDYMVGAGKDAKNMPKNLALYEPWIAQGVRPPLFTPPTTSYAPFLSF